MTKTEKQQECSRLIRKAVPELTKHWKAHVCGKMCGCNCKEEDLEDRTTHYDVHLEHVLMAIGDNITEYEKIDCENLKFYYVGEKHCLYNLSLPFDQQEEALYDFLLEVIKEV